MLHDKIKRTVSKATKKIKKGLGSLANKAADKLVPKELAPFLPLLAPVFMGPGASMLSRYLMPQLLTALSTGKTRGDISLTSQGLAGLASFLSDPNRFKLAADQAAAAEQLPAGMGQTTVPDQVGFGQLDPATGEFVFPEGGDLMLRSDGSVMTVDQLPKSTMVDGTPMNVIDAGTSNLVAVPGGGTQSVNIPVSRAQGITGTLPQTTAPSIFEAGAGRPTFSEFTDLDFGDQLRTIANEARDFMQGTNVANKFGGDQIPATQAQIDAGLARFDPYASNLESTGFGTGINRFSLDPRTQIADVPGAVMTPYASGSPLAVQDAGFLANLPRKGIQSALITTGPLLQEIEAAEEEAAALAAERAAQQQAMSDARQSLTDYYLSLSDPEGRFGALSLFAEGGPVSGITDMVNQNIDQMQDNLSQQIQGGFTTQETIVPVDEAPASTMTQPQGIQAMSNFDLFRQRMNQMRSRLQQPGAQEGPQGGGQALGRAQQGFMPLGGPFGGPSTLAYQRQRQGQSGISSLYGFANGGMATAPGMPQGMQVDGRNGTFIPMGVEEKADDVPAMLSKNEFVMTADAVRAAGGGSVEKGAQRMYDLMNSLEARV